jgi:hypothetical protein
LIFYERVKNFACCMLFLLKQKICRCLFKMLDNLKRPPGPLRIQAQAWLQQALLRGDTGRLLEPLLLVLLAPGTARLGLRQASVSHSSTVLGRLHSAAKILAVTSQDGHVVYHVSDRSNPVEARRLYAVSRLIGAEDGHCITEGNILRAAERPTEVSVTVNPVRFLNISIFSFLIFKFF